MSSIIQGDIRVPLYDNIFNHFSVLIASLNHTKLNHFFNLLLVSLLNPSHPVADYQLQGGSSLPWLDPGQHWLQGQGRPDPVWPEVWAEVPGADHKRAARSPAVLLSGAQQTTLQCQFKTISSFRYILLMCTMSVFLYTNLLIALNMLWL